MLVNETFLIETFGQVFDGGNPVDIHNFVSAEIHVDCRRSCICLVMLE